MQNKYFKTIYKFTIGFVIGLFVINANAQVAISYPTSAENVAVNYSSSQLTIRLDFNQPATSGCNVTIALPTGITYINAPFTLTRINGNNSSTIAYSGGSSTNPTFAIGPNNLPIGTYIIFKISRQASCAAKVASAAGAIFKDQVTASTSAGTVSETAPNINDYIVTYPSFSIAQPAALANAIIGTTYTRTFNISNGGNGCTEDVYLQVDYPLNGISQTSLKCNNTIITPTSIVGTTYFYKISGAFLNASQEFCNNDVLNFVEVIKVLKCNASTTYKAGWGPTASPSTWCDIENAVGNVNMATGLPLLSATNNSLINFTNKCNPFKLRTTFTNSGTGNLAAAAMYNIVLKKCDVYNYYGYPSSLIVLSTATIGTTAIPANFPAANNLAVSGPGKFYEVNTTNFFTSDPDGIGVGLDDIDKDGFFDDLPAGATLTLDINVQYNCSLLPCNTDRLMFYMSSITRYNTMCDSTQVESNLVNPGGNPFIDFVYSHVVTGTIPANILPSVPFRIRLSEASYYNQDTFRTPNSKYVYEIILPLGVSVSGTGNPTKTYGAGAPIATTITQVGNVVRFTEDANLGTYYGNLDLIYNCAVGGNVNALSFSYKYIEINDSVANCLCNSEIACGVLNTYTSCPVACPSGPTTQLPIVERANNSLGWTDNTLTTRVARSAISAYDLSKALYLDTIEIKSNGTQNNAVNNLGLHFELPRTSDDKLTPLNIDVVIKRSGVTIASGTLSIFDLSTSTAALEKIDWNLNSILPSGGLLAGDTFQTISRYKVRTEYLIQHDTQSGGLFYFFNTNSGGAQVFCNSFIAEMYLVGTAFINGNNQQNVSGCYPTALGGDTNYLARRFDSVGQMFQSEYRPGLLVTSIKATLPLDYNFVSATYIDAFSGLTLAMTPDSIVGQVYTFNNPGTWPTFPVSVTNDYGAYVPFTLQAICSTSPTIYREDVFDIYFKDFYYAYADQTVNTYNKVDNRAQGINYFNKPKLALANQTGTIQVTRPSENFVVRVSSVGFTPAPYTWIAIPNTPGVTINQFIVVATSAVISPTPYPGGNLYYLDTAGLVSSAFNDYKINFSITSCPVTSFNILAGWNCNVFPTDPNLDICSKETLTLNFTQVDAETQVIETTPTVVSSVFCAPKGYQFEISSAQAGNINDTSFKLTMPIGFAPVGGSFEVEYPRGAGNWEAVSPTIAGNIYTYDVSSVSNYPALGIPGTLNTSTPDDRFITVRFKTATDCNYVPGSKFLYSTASTKPCGSLAIGSNIDALSGD